MNSSKLPAVIALNGPAGSGKTHISRLLRSLIADATYISPMEVGYAMMQEDGLAPSSIKYHDFKRRPDARGRLIDASRGYRGRDHNVYERRITQSDEYLSSRVVIIDNVGHVSDEMEFYDRHASVSLLLRMDAPFQEIEPMKSRARRLKNTWSNDSRTPLEHHTMLTAYDSLQLTLLLDWLQRPLTREGAGPYYGIKQLWDQYFAVNSRESIAVPNGHGTSGQLGGLGEAIGIRPGEFGLRLDF